MPKSFRKPFREAFVQIEFNSRIPDTEDGGFKDNWQFVRSLQCQIIEGVFVTRGIQYAKDDHTKTHELHFRQDPALTVEHRIKYQGRIFSVLGAKQGTFFWIVNVLESSVDQPPRFMNMQGFGLGGHGIYPHVMSGGLALGGAGDVEESSSSTSTSSLSSLTSQSSVSSTSSESSVSVSESSSSITASLSSSSSSSTSSRSSSSNSSSSSTSSSTSTGSSSSSSTSSNSSSSRL